MPSATSVNLPAATLGKDFLTLQEERVRQYKVLNDAHKAYMASGKSGAQYDITTYQETVSKVTGMFKNISEAVIKMRKTFEDDHKDKDMANFLAKVQKLEEKKLKFTVDYQLALQQMQDEPSDELCERNAKGLKTGIGSTIEEINEALEEIRYHIADLKGDEEEED